MDNQTRRILLERVKASGFPRSILDVFQNPAILDEYTAQQQQQPVVAQTPQEQEQGLRPAHEAGNVGQSMVFPNVQPNQSFNTVGMKIPIDINKVDNQGNLVESYKAVPPEVYDLKTGPNQGTVIETPARMKTGGVKKYQTAGFPKKFLDPTFLNDIADSYYKNSSTSYEEKEKALKEEKERVEKVKQNVIPAARQLDLADNSRYPELGSITEGSEEWNNYINSANPKELEENRKKLPKEILDILPNQGKYTVSKWDSTAQDWAYGAAPWRELYCTPYGCFTYQRAGATDVPIVSGNVGFAAQSQKGELPFEKINAADRQAGDMALLVESAPASYIGEGSDRTVRRPHHTTIYKEPMKGKESDLEAGMFYNAYNGERGNFKVSPYTTDREKEDRIDYYRYIGQTKKIEEELKNAEKDLQSSRDFQSYSRSLIKPISSIDGKFDYEAVPPIIKSKKEDTVSLKKLGGSKTYLKGGLKNRVLYNKAKYKR